MRTEFWWGNVEEIVYLEEARVGRMIILRRIFKETNEGSNWTDVAYYMERWLSFMEVAINFRVP